MSEAALELAQQYLTFGLGNEAFAVDGDTIVVGALVDSVREVLDILPDKIEPPPRLGSSLNTDFIQGMGSCNDEFVIILDIDKVFSTDELKLAQKLSAETETGE